MVEIKPCPFCHSTDVGVCHKTIMQLWLFFVSCSDCGASGPEVKDESDAVSMWNNVARGEQ